MIRGGKSQKARCPLERVTSGALIYYRSARWSQLKHGIFTRHGGVSQAPFGALNLGGTVGDDLQAVRDNHTLVYEALGVNKVRACTVWQVHSADTVIVERPVLGRRWIALADGMVTDRRDTPLVMRFADCTPILLFDPRKGAIGLVHAGWRGTVQGACVSAVETMVQAYGCHREDLQALIGPSIGPERYQVGEEVVAAALAHFGSVEGLVSRNPQDGTAYLNLWAANALDLKRAGVTNVEIAGICTAQSTDEFYSHRAEKGRTGRFGVVMSL